MLIFHHNDLDGKCAAFWCSFIKESNKKYIEMNYNKPFPLNIIKLNEKVYIVDFSINPKEMQKLLEITKDVTWIDHHITAIEKLKDFENLPGIRYKDSIGACALTYIYLNYSKKYDETDVLFYKEKFKEIPQFTKMISKWDTWTHQNEYGIKEFILGCESENTQPSSNFWMELYSGGSNIIKKVINNGKIIMKYRNQWAKELLEDYGFETEFEGHKCYAVNLGHCNSDYFKSVGGTEKYDILLPFVFDGKQWNVSLYSGHNGVDVSVIAKKYGGGGHVGASGFICENLPFKKKITTTH